MEKYRGDLLKVLETLDKRLSGLEQATEKIGLSVGELHTQVGENWNDTTSRLATLENSSHDVGRKVNLLKEKMVSADSPHTADAHPTHSGLTTPTADSHPTQRIHISHS
jgi:chaperonin cofactor prefoldin